MALAWAGAANAMQVTKVQAFRSGAIVVDGHAVTLDELKRSLAAAKSEHGEVWFYRENPASQPTDDQFQAFQAIIDARLPSACHRSLIFRITSTATETHIPGSRECPNFAQDHPNSDCPLNPINRMTVSPKSRNL